MKYTFFCFLNNIVAKVPEVDITQSDADGLVKIVFNIAMFIVIIAGGIPGAIKIVSGVSDENPRERNAGLVSLAVTGLIAVAIQSVKAMLI